MANNDNKTIFQKALSIFKKDSVRGPENNVQQAPLNYTPNINSQKDSLTQKQQNFLDYQIQTINHDLYSRAIYFDSDRIVAYNDFRSMDMSPEIAAALSIIRDECLVRNERGNILEIYSKNPRVKEVLKNLFKDRLNVDYNMRLWIRELCKYGDFFLHLHIDGVKNKGIYDVMALPSDEIHREDNVDGIAGNTRFKWDTKNLYFEDWQIAHFRLIEDVKRLPYGTGILNAARKIWKQLQLAEDAMLTYRLVRAPQRTIFYIDVGNVDDADIRQYVDTIKSQMKKQPVVNMNNGQVNLKYNPASIEDNYYIPVRGDKSSRVENLEGACLALDTKISLLDGRNLELNEIIKEHEEGKELWSYSINPNTGQIVPGKITWAGITRKNTDVVKITFDNGESIICTPDHKFPTKFNGIKQAKDLSVGESMWSFEKKFKKIKGAGKKKRTRNTYEMIFDHFKKTWLYTHRVVANYFKGTLVNDFVYLEEYKNENKKTIHHINYNRYANDPKNLCFMNSKDYFYYHQNCYDQMCESFGDDKVEEWKEARRKGIKKFWNNISEEQLEEKIQNAKRNFGNGSGRKALEEKLKDPSFKKEVYSKISASSKITKNKPENKKRYSENSKKLWKDKDYVESVLKNQRLVYDEKLISILSEYIKSGIDEFKYILLDINREDSEFMILFKELNKNNTQFHKFTEFTHTNLTKLVRKYGYDNWKDFKKKALVFNHKVVSIEFLSEKIDTGTITIDGQEEFHNFHNFALSIGVFTQNSNTSEIADIEYLEKKLFASLQVPKPYLNYMDSMPGGTMLAQADLRFARMINSIQEAVLMELRRIANVHLLFMGFEDDLDNFTLQLTNPSTQQELLHLETWKTRLEVYKDMCSDEAKSPASYTWAMENILGFSKEEIKLMLKQKKIEKKLFAEIDSAAETFKNIGLFDEINKKFEKPEDAQEELSVGSTEDQTVSDTGGLDNGSLSGSIGGEEASATPETPEATASETPENAPEAAPLSEAVIKKFRKHKEKVFNNAINELFGDDKKEDEEVKSSLLTNNTLLSTKTMKLKESMKGLEDIISKRKEESDKLKNEVTIDEDKFDFKKSEKESSLLSSNVEMNYKTQEALKKLKKVISKNTDAKKES